MQMIPYFERIEMGENKRDRLRQGREKNNDRPNEKQKKKPSSQKKIQQSNYGKKNTVHTISLNHMTQRIVKLFKIKK
jgi:hypothetical protein